ncbi:MAG: hypothetical protein K0M78_08870, partial [Brevundimonas sp.]|nr:hypothetical protein [Brevundimonas sp.]
MTKQPVSRDDSSGQAGAIEVTLEMIEAGSEASLPYLSSVRGGDLSQLAPMLVAIYSAMTT